MITSYGSPKFKLVRNMLSALIYDSQESIQDSMVCFDSLFINQLLKPNKYVCNYTSGQDDHFRSIIYSYLTKADYYVLFGNPCFVYDAIMHGQQ